METQSRTFVHGFPVIKGLIVGIVLGVLFLVASPTGTAEAVSAQPIVEIRFMALNDGASSNPCPDRFGWDDTDINGGTHLPHPDAKHIYLCKRFGDFSEGAITAIKVTSAEDSADRCGAGYTRINQDLNQGAGGKWVYLCFQKGGVLPLIALKVISTFTCQVGDSNWTRITTNLNEGVTFKTQNHFFCYKDLGATENVTNCGNENEDTCGFFSKFFWENGNAGCDRGLRPVGGKCVNGLGGSARYQSAAADFQSTWTYWALKNQRQQIARDVPIGKVMLLGAHNAFNNRADGYPLPNQHFSITDQLRIGMRVVDLDIHAGSSGEEILTGSLPEQITLVAFSAIDCSTTRSKRSATG